MYVCDLKLDTWSTTQPCSDLADQTSRHVAVSGIISEQSILYSCQEAMAVKVKFGLSPGVSEFFRIPGFNKAERHLITVEVTVSNIHLVICLRMC